MAYVNQTRATEYGIRARLSALATAYGERMARYRLYRSTLRELAELNDRELVDLGIHRSQIEAIALESAYGQ